MKPIILLLLLAAAGTVGAQSEFPTTTALEMTEQVSAPLAVQPPPQPSTRWGATFDIGTASGLGYKLPYTAIGGTLEKPVGPRSELQARLDWSPTAKYVTNDGNTLHVSFRGLWWLTRSVAATGSDSEGALWTSQFTKYGNTPAAGVAFRSWIFGYPSRVYVSYLFPTGARPTDGSLQSNRTQGVRLEMEQQGWSRIRVGMVFEILTFLSQSGSAPSPRSTTGTFTVRLRYGTKQDATRLY